MKTWKGTWALSGIAALGLTGALQAEAAVIDFETGFSNGDRVTTVNGVAVSATGGINEAWILDTGSTENNDGDLQAGNGFWDYRDKGKRNPILPLNTPGNVLIVQERGATRPDDNAGGGSIFLDFSTGPGPVTLYSLDLFDVKSGEIEITFSDGTKTILDNDIKNSDSSDNRPNYFQTLCFGNSCNVGLANVTGLKVTFDDSGALDNISYTAVPVPAAVWLFGSALAGLVGVGYRARTARGGRSRH